MAELDAGSPGPAGVSALEVGPATLLVDTAVPQGYLGVRIEVDDDAGARGALSVLGVAGAGDLDRPWEVPARPSSLLVDRAGVSAVVLAEILAADPLDDEARAVARLELARTALEANHAWPGLDELARRSLWDLVTDPEAASALDALRRRGATDSWPHLLQAVSRRTGDRRLDEALRALGEGLAPTRAGRADQDPPRRGPGAPSRLLPSAVSPERDDRLWLDRVGDEVRVVPPPGTAQAAWVRVARRAGRVLLAAAPVSAAIDGAVRLPVPATLGTDELLVDVVDDPSVSVRSETAGHVERAVRAGRDATATARRDGWEPAREVWGRCADHGEAAGDHLRAEQAAANSVKPPVSSPFAHERLRPTYWGRR